ncbi:SpoIIE family protein phosphatase [Chitinibacteraceae bacterium HSL-7]
MKILVVDDAEAVLLLISRFVEALGHQAILARDGAEAIDVWRAQRPDLILMDLLMPTMPGAEAAVAIKQEAGEAWVPIVFVTGVEEQARLAEAIERGGDDYINKPVNFRVLEAKLKAFDRTLELNRKVREQSAKLADYYDRAEEEKRVVRHLMEQMVNAERLADPALEYWLSPAESLSGDLIASARTPGRTLHLMLADGIGHGLTAALNVLPLTQPFYAMTEKGYDLADILAEMNDKVRQVLPIGRFVCVALVAINEEEGWVDVWNGGMPTLHLIGDDGAVLHQWRSEHLPLGIVPTDATSVTPSRCAVAAAATLVAYSDGLPEARDPLGEAFGIGRLMDELSSTAPAARMQRLHEALDEHLCGTPHHDDISLVLARYSPHPHCPTALPAMKTQPVQGEVAWRYGVCLGADELRRINAVPFLMSFLNRIISDTRSVSDLFVILSELFSNALDYGVLRLDHALKRDPAQRANYLEARTARLAALASGQVEIEVRCMKGSGVLEVSVSDSGDGFAFDPLRSDDIGIGLRRVAALCAHFEVVAPGNRVIVHYHPASSSSL